MNIVNLFSKIFQDFLKLCVLEHFYTEMRENKSLNLNCHLAKLLHGKIFNQRKNVVIVIITFVCISSKTYNFYYSYKYIFKRNDIQFNGTIK